MNKNIKVTIVHVKGFCRRGIEGMARVSSKGVTRSFRVSKDVEVVVVCGSAIVAEAYVQVVGRRVLKC